MDRSHCPYCGEATVWGVDVLRARRYPEIWTSNTCSCSTCGETWGDYADEWIDPQGGDRTELWRQFTAAFATLQTIANDFSEGRQQTWITTLRECTTLHDELWSMQQRHHHSLRT